MAKKVSFNWPDNVPLEQFSKEFIQGMLDRMALGYLTYGPVERSFPLVYNALECAKLRNKTYRKTHNSENLIDEANYLMIEFMRPRDPRAHFTPTDRNGSPGAVTTSGKVVRGSDELSAAEQRHLKRRV